MSGIVGTLVAVTWESVRYARRWVFHVPPNAGHRIVLPKSGYDVEISEVRHTKEGFDVILSYCTDTADLERDGFTEVGFSLRGPRSLYEEAASVVDDLPKIDTSAWDETVKAGKTPADLRETATHDLVEFPDVDK